MKYRVTKKVVYCDTRCTHYGGCGIFDCLECNQLSGEIVEETVDLTEEQYINELKSGNIFITKVEIIK